MDRPAVVVNGSLYDASLEKACLKLGIATISQTDRPAAFNTALALGKSHLIQLWKAREGQMADRLPRYKADLNDETVPAAPEAPTFSLCTIVDNVLVLPRDVRTEFLTDPIRASEWRQLLAEFDRTFAASDPGNGQDSLAAAASTSPEAEDGAFKWSDLFPEECNEAAAFHTKYQNNIKGKCAWCPELQVYIVDMSQENTEEHDKKPMLFIEAKETYEIASNEPFLTYGAGTWLMDSKADQWLKDQEGHNHKACLCAFTSDQALVMLEAGSVFSHVLPIFFSQSSSLITCFHLQENGTDGPVQTLREAIQKLERDGMIDFDLGGHQFSRPADVMQGNSADRLATGLVSTSMHHL